MVKVIWYLLLILFCAGCIQKEIKRDDNILHCVNYLDKTSFPFDLNDYNFKCKHESIDIKFSQKTKMVLLSHGRDVCINNIYFNFTVDCDSFSDKSIKRDLFYNSIEYNLDNIYCAGKVLLNKHIDSYIFLLQDKNINSKYMNLSKIIVVNLKNNQICSIVELSDYSIVKKSNENLCRTYRWEKDYLLQLNYAQVTKLYLYRESQLPDLDRFPHFPNEKEDKISRYLEKIRRKTFQTKKLRYTVFYIDDDGFVKFKPIDKDKKSIEIFLKMNADWRAEGNLSDLSLSKQTIENKR